MSDTGAHILESLGPMARRNLEIILETLGHDPQAAVAGWRSEDPLVVALMFAASGYPVFPCTIAKTPLVPNGFYSATTDLTKICRWSHQRKSHEKGSVLAGWCVRTGRYDGFGAAPGLWDLDIDGKAGYSRLDDLELKYGPLPQTWTYSTGRSDGGEQRMFLPATFGPDMKNLGAAMIDGLSVKGLDQKGRWGYAVIPGSLHKDGRRYCWKPGCAPDEIPPATFPDAWAEIMDKAGSPPTTLRSARERRTSPPPYVRRKHERGGSLIIGDGPGGGGFNNPPHLIALRYFREEGVDAPTDVIIEILKELIVEAPEDQGRDLSRYLTGNELTRIVERARDYVTKEVKGRERVEYRTD